MTKPRHAEPAYNPYRLWAVVILGAMLIITLIIVATLNPDRDPQAVPTPAPQPTWTTYIPTTPQVCRDAMEAADKMHEQAIVTIDAAVKAAGISVKQDPAAAKKQIDAAIAANNKLTDVEKIYLSKAKGCKK